MLSRHNSRSISSQAFLIGLVTLGIMGWSTEGSASSHKEAPNIAGSPRVDGTDLYAFNSYESGRAGFTTIIANYNPLQDPFGGPNFFALDPHAIYEISVDNVGDAHEHLTFQFKFSQALAGTGGNGIALNIGGQSVAVPIKNVGPISAGNNSALNFIESYTLTLIRGDRRGGTFQPIVNTANNSAVFTKPFDYVGNKTFTNATDYEAYASQYIYNINIPGCSQSGGKVFVGQRAEGFSVNLGQVFDLVNVTPAPVDANVEPGVGNTAFSGGITKSRANDKIAGKNITSLALEIPTACLTGTGNGVIGVFTTASLPQAQLLNPSATFQLPQAVGGAYTQVSRLGMPLVNELVIGLKDKDSFNSSQPKNDATSQFGTYVTNPILPAYLNLLFGSAAIAPTNFPRTDLVAAFLTGIHGLNAMATVTPSEMLRLNTQIAATPAASQNPYGVIAGDTAGFPNGRRPGDEVVDLTLRVAMGVLCNDNGVSTVSTCTAANAPSGSTAYTDGALNNPSYFLTTFPYLNIPNPGSP